MRIPSADDAVRHSTDVPILSKFATRSPRATASDHAGGAGSRGAVSGTARTVMMRNALAGSASARIRSVAVPVAGEQPICLGRRRTRCHGPTLWMSCHLLAIPLLDLRGTLTGRRPRGFGFLSPPQPTLFSPLFPLQTSIPARFDLYHCAHAAVAPVHPRTTRHHLIHK